MRKAGIASPPFTRSSGTEPKIEYDNGFVVESAKPAEKGVHLNPEVLNLHPPGYNLQGRGLVVVLLFLQ
jgi:hypothetical protein